MSLLKVSCVFGQDPLEMLVFTIASQSFSFNCQIASRCVAFVLCPNLLQILDLKRHLINQHTYKKYLTDLLNKF